MKKRIVVQGKPWEVSTTAKDFIEGRVMESGGSNNDTEIYYYDTINGEFLSATGITCNDDKHAAILSAVKEMCDRR